MGETIAYIQEVFYYTSMYCTYVDQSLLQVCRTACMSISLSLSLTNMYSMYVNQSIWVQTTQDQSTRWSQFDELKSNFCHFFAVFNFETLIIVKITLNSENLHQLHHSAIPLVILVESVPSADTQPSALKDRYNLIASNNTLEQPVNFGYFNMLVFIVLQ